MAWSEAEKKKREAGRPSIWTEELAIEVCRRLSIGQSIRTVCKDTEMPDDNTIFRWIHSDHHGFREQYTRAKEEAADAMAEDILQISDEVSARDNNEIQKAKLRIDTRKFLMAKMKPKRYGDKLDLTSDGKALPTPIYGGKSGDTTPTK